MAIGKAGIDHGDCLEVMAEFIAEGLLFDAIVTDPPYELGFMGKKWDSTGIAFQKDTWEKAFSLLKPGGHLVAFGGTRTVHRMTCAIEDAGFEIRDGLMWLYGQGFPKSHDVSKSIDKMLGVKGSYGEPKSAAHAGWIHRGRKHGEQVDPGWHRPWMDDPEQVANAARKYMSSSPEAAAWSGWGTALKPAYEPIILARKPLIGTVAQNVLTHGTGAMNIDASLIKHVTVDGGSLATNPHLRTHINGGNGGNIFPAESERRVVTPNAAGRWPANILHDGSDEVEEAFAAFGEKSSGKPGIKRSTNNGHSLGAESRPVGTQMSGFGDSGSASRFFYCAKTSKKEREGRKHPTVKPLALMRWLCTLVTPPGGTILDPFCGSGTTLQAAIEAGFNAQGIEREDEYYEDICKRLEAVYARAAA